MRKGNHFRKFAPKRSAATQKERIVIGLLLAFLALIAFAVGFIIWYLVGEMSRPAPVTPILTVRMGNEPFSEAVYDAFEQGGILTQPRGTSSLAAVRAVADRKF